MKIFIFPITKYADFFFKVITPLTKVSVKYYTTIKLLALFERLRSVTCLRSASGLSLLRNPYWFQVKYMISNILKNS